MSDPYDHIWENYLKDPSKVLNDYVFRGGLDN